MQFFRSKEAVCFHPGAAGGVAGPAGVHILGPYPRARPCIISQLYTTGLLAGGLASTSFLNLAVAIAGERENGGLKRLAGTPMPTTAYFDG